MHAVKGSGRLIAGRYRLQEPIGRGAMGIVWRGRDELLARDVAVKEVQITAQASPADAETIYQRTLREARAAARLSHPGVVTVFDVVEENGSPWIVMELVVARSLDRVITEDGPLPPRQAAELGTSLVGALATAHSAGVLHRDVKPSNVLVTDEGRAVLTDFGIATCTGDPGQTLVGMVVGTPGFTAPERVRGDAATPASDMWSLGATLFAAVEGRGPFDRVGGATAITAGVATQDAPRAPSAGPLGPVIDALLSRDPATRPDAATATRLLAEAATASATTASPAEQRAAFLAPLVFAELSMPELTRPAEVLGSDDLGQEPLVAAGHFGDAGPGAVLVLDAAAAAGPGPAGQFGDAAAAAAGPGPGGPVRRRRSGVVAAAQPASGGSGGTGAADGHDGGSAGAAPGRAAPGARAPAGPAPACASCGAAGRSATVWPRSSAGGRRRHRRHRRCRGRRLADLRPLSADTGAGEPDAARHHRARRQRGPGEPRLRRLGHRRAPCRQRARGRHDRRRQPAAWQRRSQLRRVRNRQPVT